MTTLELIGRLRSQGVELKRQGDRLRCNAPKGVLTEQDRRQLTQRKREILDHLRRQEASAASPLPPLRPIPREGDLPLSFSQERLWFLDQFQPNSPSYNVPIALRLTGSLNCAALQQSFQAIVARHEILRSRTRSVDGRPVQQIGAFLPVPLPLIDLQHLEVAAGEAESQRLASEEARRPFDLAAGPMVRTSLIRLRHNEHILLLTTHHFVVDGWSTAIMGRELTVFYEAFTSGRPARLPDLPVQYVDVADWQRRCMQLEKYAVELTYWEERLADLPPLLPLPADRPRPHERSPRGATHNFTLPPRLSQALREFSRDHQVTLFVTLLAAFQTLLHRYAHVDDIVVSTAVSNRNHVAVEGLIGTFANSLVLRTDFTGNPTFRALLDQVRDVAAGAFAHQDLPFEKLVEHLRPKRSMQNTPLFQVMFTLHQSSLANQLNWPELKVRPLEVDTGTARFDLNLSLVDEDQSLRGRFEYSTDLFQPATIERVIGHFQVLLEGIVANPGQRIGELPLLTEAERQQILVQWNGTGTDYPRERCLHELFERQVERTPDAIAAICGEQALTYRELNGKANRLAQDLIGLGTGPEVLVGLCVERSLEMMVGLLGILKAGGAYVPLDPEMPISQLQFIVRDAELGSIVTTSRHAALFTAEACDLILVDDLPDSQASGTVNPVSTATTANPVYLLYTSGSTGHPKGVVVEHGQLLNYVHAVVAEYGMTGGGASAMVQPLSVDSSQTMIFPALGWGGTVHLISRERALDASALADYFVRHSIDYLKIAPSHLSALLAVDQPQRLLPARALIVGGEALSWTLVSRLADLQPTCRVWNHYGPTETTVGVFTYPIDLVDDQHRHRSATVPIGRPLANVTCYVLDRHEAAVPAGVAGELYVGGEAVTRGYLKRAELTAQQFVPDRFAEAHRRRLYRSGDFVRWLPGGDVEFLGRQDGQLKIRGIRIETGAIEAALHEHPDVRESVVIMQTGATGNPFLAAYVVSRAGRAPSIQSLRELMARRLPEVMRPTVYVFLEALPRTPHGKVNRQALPVPEIDRLELAVAYVAPRTPIEELLAGIWCDVLGVEQVGIHDNFFELGGHSLLATQVVARVRDAFGVDLPVRSLFESPTVAGLAERVETARSGPVLAPDIPLRPMPRDERLPLSFAQERLWFLDQFEPGGAVYNIPRGMRLRGRLDVPALEQSLREIIRRHEVFRTTFAGREGEPEQVIAGEVDFRMDIIDLSSLPEPERESEARRLAAEEARRPFDLSRDLMLRGLILRLEDQEHQLVLTQHHIASDGWSLGIFQQELAMLYEAFAAGRPSPLPELPLQYADYAIWQREWLQGETLNRQLSYWKEQLAGAPAALELPTDFPRPTVPDYRGARQELVLDQELVQALLDLSRREGTTLFMTLLAGFQLLLSRYSGQDDVVVVRRSLAGIEPNWRG